MKDGGTMIQLPPEYESLLEDRDITDVIRSLQVNLGYSPKVYLPTIDEFIEKDYYLGKSTDNGKAIYPYWRDKLREFYPNPLYQSYDTMFFRDSIGSGKSTVARICVLYNMMKIIEMDDPFEFFGLMKTKDIVVFLFSLQLSTIHSAMYGSLINILDSSDYFKSRLHPTRKGRVYRNNVVIDYGSTISKNVGKDIIIYWMDEIQIQNYRNQNLDNYNSLKARRKSRFMIDGGRFFNSLALLTGSPGTDRSFSESLTKKNEDKDRVYISQAPQWEVLRHKLKLSGRTFKLFVGDDNNEPKIISDEKELLTYQSIITDQSKIIDVPIEYRSEFEDDILIAIRDIAGVVTRSTTSFITNTDKLSESYCMSRKFFNLDLIKLPFFDETRIEDFLIPTSGTCKDRLLNPKEPRFIHIDIGLVSDLSGISMSHIAGWVELVTFDPITRKYVRTKEPWFINDFNIGISRLANEETAIHKIRDFILYLQKQNIRIYKVSADGYQSAQILQELKFNRVSSEKLSIKTDHFDFFRRALYTDRVKIQKNELSKNEFLQFQKVVARNSVKVTHPSTKTSGSHGDIAESIVGSIVLADKYKNTIINPLSGISNFNSNHGIFTDEDPDSEYEIMKYL